MRVTFLTSKLNFVNGGGSNFCRHNKSIFLQNHGCEVKIITVFSDRNKFVAKPSYKILEENINYDNLFHFHKSIKAILKKYEEQTDIYHVDGHIFLYGAGLYKKQGGKLTIAHFDNLFPEIFSSGSGWFYRMKLFLRKCFIKTFLLKTMNSLDLLTFGSPILRDKYRDFGLDTKCSLILPSFTDFSPLDRAGRFSCKSQGGFHILYVGRLVKEKGVNLILEAAKLLNRDDYVLDIVGDGPDKQNLVSQAGALGIGDRVNWYSWIDRKDISAVYKHAQVFISPSIIPECFGMTTAEAMYCGLPVIVSSGTGPAWIAENGAGLIFKNGQAADLAEKIRAVLDDKKLREKLARSGLTRVENLKYEKFALELYEKMKELSLNN